MPNLGRGPQFYTRDNDSDNKADLIDLKSTGATRIYEGSASFLVSPIAVAIEVVESDSASNNPVISVGTNNPDYDDLVEAFAVSLVEGTTVVIPLNVTRLLPASTDIYVNVLRAASGTTLTAVVSVNLLTSQIEP